MRGIDFNQNWMFYLGDNLEGHARDLNESQFRNVILPHDWSVEFEFDKEKGEACTGYLLGGIGWYRKHFVTTKEMENKKVYLNFDGMYERADIYMNGEIVTFHPYGYSPCLLDITDYLLKQGEDNVVAVRIDHERYANSRWYTGSGIYRKVSMHILPELHIPVWGISLDTKECNADRAVVSGQYEIENSSGGYQRVNIRLSLYGIHGEFIKEQMNSKEFYKDAKERETFEFQIENPELWEIHDGKQYIFQIEVLQDEKVIQKKKEKFGIRKFRFDCDKGFIFNGRNVLIKGVCLHHDAGALGAAVPLDVWRRRLEELKNCGCNAIRTAHNPASEDFLDLCDEMGFLVQEEFFDEWDNPKDKRRNGEEKITDYITRSYTEFFRDYAKMDVQNVVLRDRNHPCIFQWSIGNEIEWTYTKYNSATGYFTEGKGGFWYWWNLPPYSKEKIAENISRIARSYYDIGSTAKKLSSWVKEIDVTRPVTGNCILPTASYETGYGDALDLMGYSYRSVIYDYGKKYYKDKPIMGTENVGQWREWKAVLDHEHIPGIFLWTGIDHMGEAWVQKSWPRKGSNLGLLDFAGFHKPSYYMFQSLWTDEPVIRLETQVLEKSLYKIEDGQLVAKDANGWKQNDWHWQEVNPYWNYKNGEMVVIEAYSNCDQITLYCNDKKVETLYLKDFEDHIYKWAIPYESGKLRAVGKKDQLEMETSLETEGEFDSIEMVSDKTSILLNTDSVAHIVVKLKDKNGKTVKNKEQEVEFTVSKNAKILGVDNGNPDNVRKYQNNQVNTWHGKAILYVQAIEEGTITIQCNVNGKKHVSQLMRCE